MKSRQRDWSLRTCWHCTVVCQRSLSPKRPPRLAIIQSGVHPRRDICRLGVGKARCWTLGVLDVVGHALRGSRVVVGGVGRSLHGLPGGFPTHARRRLPSGHRGKAASPPDGMGVRWRVVSGRSSSVLGHGKGREGGTLVSQPPLTYLAPTAAVSRVESRDGQPPTLPPTVS